MNKPQATSYLQSLLQQSPLQVQHWLEEVENKRKNVPSDFNWPGFAEAAAFEARRQKNLAWADIAITVYEHLIETTDPTYKNGLMSSIMHLRAFMITQLGVVKNNTILDPDYIVQWFFESLPFTYEEAMQKAAHWRTLNIQEIKALRLIKSRLSVISSLVESNNLHPDVALQLWLSLQKDLP